MHMGTFRLNLTSSSYWEVAQLNKLLGIFYAFVCRTASLIHAEKAWWLIFPLFLLNADVTNTYIYQLTIEVNIMLGYVIISGASGLFFFSHFDKQDNVHLGTNVKPVFAGSVWKGGCIPPRWLGALTQALVQQLKIKEGN